MAITRNPNNLQTVTDWTDQINEVPNQSSFFKSKNLFNIMNTSQEAVIFDKIESEATLLPQVNKRTRETTYGKDRVVETFALPLGYFKHSDYVTVQDVQGQRLPGTPDSPETVANAKAKKLEDLRIAVDQTHEYMMINAMKGVSKTPDGAELVNMYNLFGLTQETVDFDLSTASTIQDLKVSEVKRKVQRNIRTGGMIRGIEVACSESFFDAFKNHATVKENYLNSQSNARYQDSLSEWLSWGVSDAFVFGGITFYSYGHEFILPNGNTEAAIEDGFAYAYPIADNVFRGHYGPSNKLSRANQAGAEMFAFEYDDGRDEAIEMQVETAPLFYNSKPRSVLRLQA